MSQAIHAKQKRVVSVCQRISFCFIFRLLLFFPFVRSLSFFSFNTWNKKKNKMNSNPSMNPNRFDS